MFESSTRHGRQYEPQEDLRKDVLLLNKKLYKKLISTCFGGFLLECLPADVGAVMGRTRFALSQRVPGLDQSH